MRAATSTSSAARATSEWVALAAQDLDLQPGPRRPDGKWRHRNVACDVKYPLSNRLGGNAAFVGNSRSRPRWSAASSSPSNQAQRAASSPLAWPISWLDCPPTTVRCWSCGTWKGCRSPRWPAAWAGLPEPSASSGCGRSISSAGCCKRRNSYDCPRCPSEEALEPTSEVISILEEFLAELEAGGRLNPED